MPGDREKKHGRSMEEAWQITMISLISPKFEWAMTQTCRQVLVAALFFVTRQQ
jgi:hypothetical protein